MVVEVKYIWTHVVNTIQNSLLYTPYRIWKIITYNDIILFFKVSIVIKFYMKSQRVTKTTE